MPVHLTCSGCSAPVTRPPSRANFARAYCSVACQKNRVIVPCKACGTPIETKASKARTRSYCSPECRAQRPVPVEVRFWRYVDKDDPVPPHCPELGPCWLWTGSKDVGYGKIETWSRTDGKGSVKAHRLALAMKLGRPILPGLKALHHCDNKGCVRDTHLYEGTTQDNSDDAVARDRMPRGERNPNTKLTDAQREEIRDLYTAGARQVDIAAQYGVEQTTVSRYVRGLTGGHHCNTRLPDAIRAEIKRMRATGMTQSAIAAVFGIHQTAVSRIIKEAGG